MNYALTRIENENLINLSNPRLFLCPWKPYQPSSAEDFQHDVNARKTKSGIRILVDLIR